MNSEIDRFWAPAAQLLPVLVLALTVEARATLRGRAAGWRRRDSTARKMVAVGDIAADLIYSVVFLLAMVFLVAAFIVALDVIAVGRAAHAAIEIEFAAIVTGVVLTGLLPVARIFNGKIEHYLLNPVLSAIAIRLRARRAFRDGGVVQELPLVLQSTPQEQSDPQSKEVSET